ncbi:MAG: pyridoxamine 5'-phosphate oxidase family protein [Candidatus Gygaella obscura]|nr:pyridoxamine 5'-phosphate oxidase family protein [Candidatus Gygaella obscura]
MIELSEVVVKFFEKQGCVLVSTFSNDGSIHSSCKGIVRIDPKGKIYIMDLYQAVTYNNLKTDNRISITAFNEHQFIGYSLKGKAEIMNKDKITESLISDWNRIITSRITNRLMNNIKNNTSSAPHYEANLPKPNYLILVMVDNIIDLKPKDIKLKG